MGLTRVTEDFVGTPTVSDVVDLVADEMENNHNWDSEEDSGSVSAGTIERWLYRPAGETANGRRIMAGMRVSSGDIELNTIYSGSTYASATNFRRKVGQPTISAATADGSYMELDRIRSNSETINDAWVITPEDTSDDSTDHQFFYVVIQTNDNNWYQFGFGELDKTNAITYTGGEFMTASDYAASGDLRLPGPIFGGDGAYTGTRAPSSGFQSSYRRGAVYTGGLGGASASTRGWAHHATSARGLPDTTSGDVLTSNLISRMRGLINDAGYSAGYNFSMPLYNYIRAANATSSLQYIGAYPRVRQGNISGRSFGSTFTEGGITYFPVPFHAITGNTNNSGYYGLYFITDS